MAYSRVTVLLCICLITSFNIFSVAPMNHRDEAAALESWRRGRRSRINAGTNLARDEEAVGKINGGRSASEDLIGRLPGQPDDAPIFQQFGGYVTVDEKNGRNLFYYFAESPKDAASKPLVLWLNGGPGCSSMLGGLVEIGPFGVNSDGETLYTRQFAWNKLANTLFLESPAGVGFSYSNTSSDYDAPGDTKTADDSYTFLVNWFERFPQYKTRDFYIAGESYAGYYIPELVDVILKRNLKSEFKIQLKGIMVGNGVMNEETDDRGTSDFLWSHALISNEVYKYRIENCTDCNPIYYGLGQIDPYNIYGPVCVTPLENEKWNPWYDPCEQNYLRKYLNRPEVQNALHANTTHLNYTWELCSFVLGLWTDYPSTMYPIYRRMMAAGLRILLYSGDIDSVVPVTGTRLSIDGMGLKVVKAWAPWHAKSKRVAGYRVLYEGLNFSTVRGAGHMVPQHQPERAFILFKKFLSNRM